MRLSGITYESVVDGPGIRFVVFVQGCEHNCPNCHNQESLSINGGKEVSVKEVIKLLKKQNKYIKGVTISGGEPFLQAKALAEFAVISKKIGMDVVTYTGFTYEELLKSDNEEIKKLLDASDILIDGKYIHELRDLSLKFCGSSNQRIIDLVASKKLGEIVILK